MDEKLAKIRQYARAKGTFTAPQLQLDTCMGYITVAHALEALLREGSVSFDGKRYTWIRPDMSGRERELRIQMLEDSIAKIDEQNRRLAEQYGAEFGDDSESSDDDDDDTDYETDDERFADDDEDDELDQFIAEMNLSDDDDDDEEADDDEDEEERAAIERLRRATAALHGIRQGAAAERLQRYVENTLPSMHDYRASDGSFSFVSAIILPDGSRFRAKVENIDGALCISDNGSACDYIYSRFAPIALERQLPYLGGRDDVLLRGNEILLPLNLDDGLAGGAAELISVILRLVEDGELGNKLLTDEQCALIDEILAERRAKLIVKFAYRAFVEGVDATEFADDERISEAEAEKIASYLVERRIIRNNIGYYCRSYSVNDAMFCHFKYLAGRG